MEQFFSFFLCSLAVWLTESKQVLFLYLFSKYAIISKLKPSRIRIKCSLSSNNWINNHTLSNRLRSWSQIFLNCPLVLFISSDHFVTFLQVWPLSCLRAGLNLPNKRNFMFWMLTLVTIARQCCQWYGRQNCYSQLCCSQSDGFCVAPNGYEASSLLWPRTEWWMFYTQCPSRKNGRSSLQGC